MPGEELTRFPIQPQDRHATARSSDDVAAVPEESVPGKVDPDPPDKPSGPPGATADDGDHDDEWFHHRGGRDD